MDEQKKRKLAGERLYKIYRRIRYVRYLRKLNKQRQRERKTALHAEVIRSARTVKKSPSLSFRIYTVYRKIRFLRYKRSLRKAEMERLRKERKAQRFREKEIIQQNIRTKGEELRLHEIAEKRKLKLERKEIRRRRRRLIRFVLKRQSKIYLHNLTHPAQYYRRRILPGLRSVRENREKRNKFLVIFSNSTVYFVLSYLVIYILGIVVTIWTSQQYDYKMIIFYYKVYYDIESTEWFGDAVRALYSTMPVTALFLGLVFLIVYSNIRREAYRWKLFFLWGFIHGFTFFFGAMLFGTLMNKGFGYVLLYMYYSDTSKLIFALSAIFVLITTGAFSVKSIMMSANIYFRDLTDTNKSFFMISQFFLPLLAGTIILIVLKFPDNLYYTTMDYVYFEILKLLAIVIVAIPVMLSYRSYLDLFFDEIKKPAVLQWKAMVIVVVLIILLRAGLSAGIRIGDSIAP